MPTRIRDDGIPIVTFDPILEISPFTLLKRLQRDQPPLLIDIRPVPGNRTLAGAVSQPNPKWTPDETDAEVVLFDEDGSLAVAAAHRLQEAGFSRIKALFGGLELYEFALDPEILESDTFLRVDS
jgi:rhodanese-related sulfurtransferase